MSKVTTFDSLDKKHSKLSVCQKLTYVLTQITVEPFIFLFMVAILMNNISTQNLQLEKACRVNLHLNASVCDGMVARNKALYDTSQEAEVQQLVSRWAAIKASFSGTIPVFLMVFVGSWSDRHSKRKPIILIPGFGDLVSTLGLLICSFYFMELSMEYSWFAETLPSAFTGSIGMCCVGMYSYVSGISSDESRTIRIGAVSLSQTLALSVGTFLGGITVNSLGFKGVYTVVACILSTAIIYGLLRIKEEVAVATEEKKEIGFFKDLFALKHIKNTFRICFKNGEGDRRKKMIVLILISIMTIGPLQGEIYVIYLYQRFRFGWNEIDFSIFHSIHFIIQVSGSTFALSFFSKYLKTDDATLGMVAMISKSLASLVYAFAPSGLYVYVGAVVEVFNGTSYIALRSIMAKIVPPHELGQTNSCFGIVEALCPLLFGSLYSTLYMKTLMFFPGSFFLISFILFVISFFLYGWLYRGSRTSKKVYNSNEERTKLAMGLLQKEHGTERTFKKSSDKLEV